MLKKKITIEEWNKDLFHKLSGNDFNKNTKIIPHFITWTTNQEDEEDTINEWKEIDRIDFEFEDGSKVSIIPKSNRDEVNLEDNEENPLSLALDVIQYRAEEINWREKK